MGKDNLIILVWDFVFLKNMLRKKIQTRKKTTCHVQKIVLLSVQDNLCVYSYVDTRNEVKRFLPTESQFGFQALNFSWQT